ncbi:MAG TPA: rhomboid family intramembrane serine protease [Chryseosolibacter sp.]|nr:rhomboid family intramembrane serine protease [Chryseosolibacter sp.]
MNIIRQIPATITLLALNILIFGLCFLHAGTFEDPKWLYSLLAFGALYNPFTLDGEWYRIFMHMFLHGHLIHLAVNMFALYSLGREVESALGSKKFLLIYFLSGLGSALLSLYWNEFVVGVGASGAIFGLYGFTICAAIMVNIRDLTQIKSILLNFVIFAGLNLALAESFNADNAAHIGGMLTGVALAAFTFLLSRNFKTVRVEFPMLLGFVVIFFLLPTYQVSYYQFFQQVISNDERARDFSKREPLNDADYLTFFKAQSHAWDSAVNLLNAVPYVPADLQQDTFKLRRYIHFRELENDFRISLLEDESYIFMDSIEIVQDSMSRYTQVEHRLLSKQMPVARDEPEPGAGKGSDSLVFTKVWYDKNWIEIERPGTYYRLGYRDTAQQWQGPVRDYYANGDIQMKGVYKNSKRDGVFLYYSDHRTYESAGRYKDDYSTGKWQYFHVNGRLAREVVYDQISFVKNVWDSTGNLLVSNGNGTFVEHFANGQIKTSGEYLDGKQEGTWLGYFENGDLHYKEEFLHGKMVSGRSRSKKGETFVYDGSVIFPQPANGYAKFYEWLDREVQKTQTARRGMVKVSFAVTPTGVLTDFNIEESVSSKTDKLAVELLKSAPRWRPALLHGYIPDAGYAVVTVNFD